MRVNFSVIAALLLFFCAFSAGTNAKADEKQLVLRQAMEDTKAMVGVEAYLAGDILEVQVSVAMEKTRPSVLNVIVMGPGIGRLIPITVKQVYAALEEEPPYETIKVGGFIDNRNKKLKNLEGNISRKLVKFRIPKDKIVGGGEYQLKVKVGTVKQPIGYASKNTKFDFDISNLAGMINR